MGKIVSYPTLFLLLNPENRSKKELVERASKALVDELNVYFSSPQQRKKGSFELRPDASLIEVMKTVRQDSVTWGAITTLVDKTLESGWVVVDEKSGNRNKKAEKQLRNKGFDFWLREMLTQYFVFQNAFGELVYTPSNFVKELYVVDPTTMKIASDKHGEVLYYYQQLHGDTVSWRPDEILHVHDPNLGMNTWGELLVTKLYQAIYIKAYIKKFILWLFKTNQFRGNYVLKSVDEDSVKRFMTYLRQGEKDISKPVIIEGDVEYFVQRKINEIAPELNLLMYKMDEEILNLLQVPPIYAGLPDNSNRSNSDAQERAFNTRIASIQKLFEHFFRELLQRMQIYNAVFRFKPISRKNEKELLEIAQLMKSMSMKGAVIAEYLREKGMSLPEGELFETEPQTTGGSKNDKQLLIQAQAPSRRGKGVDQANQKIGTGEESTTRQEQISRAEKFGKYPYVIENAL